MSSRKNDLKDKKSRLDLIPAETLWNIGHIFRHGAEKYAEYNYRSYPGLKYSRMLAAAKRHMIQFEMGENLDESSAYHHLEHAICELIMVLDSQVNGYPGQDDRVKKRL